MFLRVLLYLIYILSTFAWVSKKCIVAPCRTILYIATYIVRRIKLSYCFLTVAWLHEWFHRLLITMISDFGSHQAATFACSVENLVLLNAWACLSAIICVLSLCFSSLHMTYIGPRFWYQFHLTWILPPRSGKILIPYSNYISLHMRTNKVSWYADMSLYLCTISVVSSSVEYYKVISLYFLCK